MRTDLVTISHDAFARTELQRRVVPVRDSVFSTLDCDYCGSCPHGRLFQYYQTPDDSGRANPIKGLFCSIGCMRSYHG